MPGPTRAQLRQTERAFPHQVEIARPNTPGWPALNCYSSWLAIRAIGQPQQHHRQWAKQIFPTEITAFGFRDAGEAEAFRRFAEMIAPLDEPALRLLREALSGAFEPHKPKPHST